MTKLRANRNYPKEPARNFERDIPGLITAARELDAQRRAQERAKVELQKIQEEERRKQLLEQVQRDKKAAEEANRAAEVERSKLTTFSRP
jgi:hypothetical protein